MNLFLPYPEDLVLSVRCLDDRRLMKQIVETKVLLDIALSDGTHGYARHPVAEHYRNQPEFLRFYGFVCCREYSFRFDKKHAYDAIFEPCDVVTDYTPFYAEGFKNKAGCIRTTENVGLLFRAKLCRKWSDDVKKPKWTKRKAPVLYNLRKQRGDLNGKKV
jgi:hypothetical protein